MKKFAKIIEVNGVQVVVMRRSDNDPDNSGFAPMAEPRFCNGEIVKADCNDQDLTCIIL